MRNISSSRKRTYRIRFFKNEHIDKKKVGHIINVFSFVMCPIFHAKTKGGGESYEILIAYEDIKLMKRMKNSFYK